MAAVVAIGLGVFLLRPAQSGVVFRYAFASGERRAYALDMQISLVPRGSQANLPFEGRVRASMGMSVVERREDGSTILDLVLDEIETSPQRTTTPLEGGRLRLTIARDGRILDVEGTGGVFSIAGVDPSALLSGSGGSTEGAGSQLLFPHFPPDAIEPGDRWSRTSTIPLPFGDERIRVRAEGRFEGYEDSPLGRSARIRFTIDTPIDTSVTVGELTRAATEAGADAAPLGPPDARIVLDGRTVTDSRALVLPGSSELVRLTGTTTMSVDMTVEGAPQDQPEGGLTAYAFDATIKMSIVRAED